MPFYRRKPVVVEAELLTPANIERLADWVNNHGRRKAKPFEAGLEIPTLEGSKTASFGDYVIRGEAGEFHPCKPDVFKRTHDLVAPWAGRAAAE